MIAEFLIRWGPLTVLVLTVGAHLGRSYWLRRASPALADPAGTADSALGFIREVHRRSLGVMLAYFACRALFPLLEQDFGRVEWLAEETIRLFGLALAVVGAVWILMMQFAMGAHWSVDVPARALPWLVNARPFALSRNPVLLGVLAEAMGLFLTSPTALTLMALTTIWLGTQLQVRLEEEYLRASYGADYLSYCQRVRRWL